MCIQSPVLKKKIFNAVTHCSDTMRVQLWLKKKKSVYTCTTCWEMRPQRCSSFPEDRAMLAAMAGGGLVFRLLQVQISWARACSVSILSFTKSHWNIRGLRGVLAALIHIDTHNTRHKCIFTIYTQQVSCFLYTHDTTV